MRIEAQAMFRISTVLSLILTFFSRPGWVVDATRTIPTSLVPLHRQLLRDIEQHGRKSSQAHAQTELHSTEEARNTASISSSEYSPLSYQEWIKLDETPATSADGIPPARRGHSSTIYRINTLSGIEDGTTTNSNDNSTTQGDNGPLQHPNYAQEYMITSGGFTAEEWSTFPVWSYDITGAILNNHGEWKLIDVEKSEEGFCTESNDIDNSNDLKDGRDLWNNALNCPPQSRYGHMSVVVNDYLYVFGGLLYHQQTGMFVMEDEPYIYRLNLSNPAAWQRIVARVLPPSHLTNLTDNGIETEKFIINRGEVRGGYWEEGGKLVIYGGLHVQGHVSFQDGKLQQKDETLGDVWAYDFESATWEMMAPQPPELIINDGSSYYTRYPEPRTSHAATIVGNELVICGGLKKIETLLFDGTTLWEQLTDVWIFDLKTRLWKEREMSQAIGRSHHSLVGWKHPEFGTPIVASFGGYKTLYDAMSSVPRPITYVYDDTLISYPSETNWRAVEAKVSKRPMSRREHTAVISEFGNMLIWGGRLKTTEDEDVDGVWSLNVKLSLAFDAQDDDDENQALEEFYLLVTTIFFISMMFTYMCGTLARHSSNDMNDGVMDHGDHFPGFDSTISPFGRSNGLGQDIIETLPLKTYHHNDSPRNDLDGEQDAPPILGQTPLSDARRESEVNQELDNDAEDEACCAICLVNYKDGDELRSLPCGHEFHKTCIDAWLGNNASCPTCRYSLQSLVWLSVDSSHPMSWARISNLTLLGSNTVENTSETGIRPSNSPQRHATVSSLMARFRSQGHGAEILVSNSDSPGEGDTDHENSGTSNDLPLAYSSSIELTGDTSSLASPENRNDTVTNDNSIYGRAHQMRVGIGRCRADRGRVGNIRVPLNDPLQAPNATVV